MEWDRGEYDNVGGGIWFKWGALLLDFKSFIVYFLIETY